MIKLGEGWTADGNRVFHECGPGVRVENSGAPKCQCGLLVPRHVQRFEQWLTGGRRELLIDALLRDDGLEIEESYEPEPT